MHILYISYWGVNEVLCHSTVLPHLEILSNDKRVEKITLITIERDRNRSQTLETPINKVDHVAIVSDPRSSVILTKIKDVVKTKKELKKIVLNNKIDFVIGRTVLAGIFCNHLFKKYKIPFAVESYEPHSKYMLKGNVWKWYDPRYIFQNTSEKNQLKNAFKIMTVSENYAIELREKHPTKNIVSVPCATNFNDFKQDLKDRQHLRQVHGIAADDIIGVYVGKFGDIYHSLENFIIRCKEIKSNFNKHGISYRTIILSPQHKELEANNLLTELGTIVKFVPHNEVSSYLSASDLAFCLQLSSSVSNCFSPIKNGEYWACGLPILMGENIGDDSSLVKENSVGYILDFSRPIDNTNFERLKEIILDPTTNKNCIQTAQSNRSFETVKTSYEEILNKG